jgi:hypothetical protein
VVAGNITTQPKKPHVLCQWALYLFSVVCRSYSTSVVTGVYAVVNGPYRSGVRDAKVGASTPTFHRKRKFSGQNRKWSEKSRKFSENATAAPASSGRAGRGRPTVRTWCRNGPWEVCPGANVIKLFTAVSYTFSLLVRAYFTGKPFQPSLMFAGKTGAYPSEASFRCSTLV